MTEKIVHCESSAEARTATSKLKTGDYTLKRKDEHTEPFRSVLLDVMNSTTRFDNIFERGDIYGKKTET